MNLSGRLAPETGAASTHGSSAVLALQEVTAGYTRDVEVLQGVSLRVPRGHLVGLVGLNGAGKSTLMKTIYGFVPPMRGRVFLCGDDVTAAPPHQMLRRGVWYIPQESGLFPYLSVEDHLWLIRRKLLSLRPARTPASVEEVLRHFPGLKDLRRRQAGDLSGGQQKMLEFAKALMVRPRLCLIDEPTIGLAPKMADEVYRWIEVFRREGMTILLVDHNIRRVVQVADYVYVLSLGRIAAEGPREEFERELHQQVREWLGIRL